MKTTAVTTKNIIGIAVRTTNQNGQAAQDIPTLWGQFMSKGIAEQIPNKVNGAIYSIYTQYAGDHTEPYTAILGCEVSSLEDVPAGMVSTTIESGDYTQFEAVGDLNTGVVYSKWLQIWEIELNRSYTTDFEIYGEGAQDPTNATIPIFIATN